MSEGTDGEILATLERGEIHLGQNLFHAVRLDDKRFGQQPLEPVELLAGYAPGLKLGRRGEIEVAELAPHPLLLLEAGFGFRCAFDAAARLA